MNWNEYHEDYLNSLVSFFEELQETEKRVHRERERKRREKALSMRTPQEIGESVSRKLSKMQDDVTSSFWDEVDSLSSDELDFLFEHDFRF